MKELMHFTLALVTLLTLGLAIGEPGIEPASAGKAPVMTDSMAPIFRATGVVGLLASGLESQAMPDERNLCKQADREEKSPEQVGEKAGCARVKASVGIIGQVIRLLGR